MSYYKYGSSLLTTPDGKFVTNIVDTPYVNITETTLSFDEYGTPCDYAYVHIVSNTIWRIYSTQTFVNLTPTWGVGDSSVAFTVSSNAGQPARSSSLVIQSYGVSDSCTINQLATGAYCD